MYLNGFAKLIPSYSSVWESVSSNLLFLQVTKFSRYGVLQKCKPIFTYRLLNCTHNILFSNSSLCAVLIYRLLSWAGKSIEPYGVDYILQKLGFSHARTTIPKWMQRGFMDPLDKVLAVLMLRMITVVREEPQASEWDSDKKQTDGK